MMNKHIRIMIDEIFCEMKMTAENLALRDELLANAQARYEDAMAAGKTEDEAFAEVAASLGDVHALLEEINRPAPEADASETEPQEAQGAQTQENAGCEAPETDLGEALNKAFAALGDWGQQVVPQAKKFVRQMDDATGGMIRDIGKAAQKGLQDAQKAAEETIGKLAGDKGELIFDFGPKRQEKPAQEEDADALRARAEDLRAQASIKEVTGDAQGAAQLRAQADKLDMQANAAEQAQAVKAAQQAAQEAAAQAEEAAQTEQPNSDEPAESAGEEAAEPLMDENGEVDEDALSRAVDEMTRAAEELVNGAGKVIDQAAEGVRKAVHDAVNEADYVVRDANEPVSGRRVFPAAGLHKIDIQLDADDVCIEASSGGEVETLWEARNVDVEPAVEMAGHTLTIRRKNPDVFKTFFSVFQKDGGRITVRVPVGYAASYAVTTTSGDVLLRGLDADDVKVNTTSGCVRVETLTTARSEKIAVTTVSGHATVSACADDIAVTTVSGDQFVSCDAHKVDVNVVSGKVHVEGACDEWEIDAVSSDVELLCTIAPTKSVKISSMHGMVRLALPDDIRGFVAETNSALGCPIVNEFGPNRYGTCALPIRMETMRGQLMITRL